VIHYRPKFRLQKKYVAFLTIVPLLTATSILNTGCPVCEGDGVLSGSHNMESVRISGLDYQLVETVPNACAMFLLYRYRITITLSNDSNKEAIGWVKLTLVDFTVGKPLDNQYAVVEVPPRKTIAVRYMVLFGSGLQEHIKTDVYVQILTEDAPCPVCSGTGNISLNTYPIVNALKESFIQEAKSEVPWQPPAWEEAMG